MPTLGFMAHPFVGHIRSLNTPSPYKHLMTVYARVCKVLRSLTSLLFKTWVILQMATDSLSDHGVLAHEDD